MIRKLHRRYIESFKGLSREVWLIALLMFINRSGAMVLPFLSVYLTQRLNFTLQETGWVMGAFGFGSLIGVYLGGYLTDKFGNYKVMLWSLLLNGGMLFILQKMDTFIQFSILIFLTSIISDAFRPANMTAVAIYSKPMDRTRSITLVRLAINAGWGIGPAIGGIVALNLGYHWLFWLDGITCIIAGIFLLVFLNPVRKKKENPNPQLAEPKRKLFKDHVFLLFLGLNTLIMLVFFQLFSTVPVFLKTQLMLNEGSIGLVMALNGILIAIIEMPLVYMIEKRFHTLKIIILGTIFITIAYTVYNLGNWQGLAAISIIIITFGEIFHMPFANTFTMSRADDAQLGKYMSYYGMSFSLAFILAPVMGMHLADGFGYQVLWNILTGLGILATAGYFLLYRYMIKTERP